jgi:hypothetical protein
VPPQQPGLIPAVHAVPQAPQCCALCCRSTQAPLQQALPVAQACADPQAPHWLESVPVLTHVPAQQLSPVAQLFEHEPQCWASVCRSKPSSAVPLQSSSTPLQTSGVPVWVTHVSAAPPPFVHCSVPLRHGPLLASTVHALPRS